MASVSYTISELADRIGATVHGDPNCIIQGVNSLAQAKSGELSFLLGGAYRRLLPSTKASVVVLSEQDLPNCPVNAIVTSNPELGFTKLLHLFHSPPQHASGQHSTAVLGEETQLAEGVSIGAHCVIGDRVSIGANTVIAPGCQIGDDVVIGAGTYLYSNVTVYHCVQIGNRVILHSGAVIGSDGFGLTNDQGQWVKIPQVGTVVIEDDVEVGANSVIDRGALENTLIEQGVKIDNLVQIAHNVRIGAHSVIAGCTGISGSVQIGRHCIVGGGACINGHITLADQVVITGMAMVTHSITEPGVYSSGTGIQNNREWRKSAVRFQQLDKLAKRVQHIERMVDE